MSILAKLRAQLDPVGFILARGWRTAFIDDGYGPSGWFAYKGDYAEPEFETGICGTAKEAAREALKQERILT